jgi:hypothetical protein
MQTDFEIFTASPLEMRACGTERKFPEYMTSVVYVNYPTLLTPSIGKL